jgi:hypothetical protein
VEGKLGGNARANYFGAVRDVVAFVTSDRILLETHTLWSGEQRAALDHAHDAWKTKAAIANKLGKLASAERNTRDQYAAAGRLTSIPVMHQLLHHCLLPYLNAVARDKLHLLLRNRSVDAHPTVGGGGGGGGSSSASSSPMDIESNTSDSKTITPAKGLLAPTRDVLFRPDEGYRFEVLLMTCMIIVRGGRSCTHQGTYVFPLPSIHSLGTTILTASSSPLPASAISIVVTAFHCIY